MRTYPEDLEHTRAQLRRWARSLALARTKCRKLRARLRRLEKLVSAGVEKKKRQPPGHLRVSLPVVQVPLPEV